MVVNNDFVKNINRVITDKNQVNNPTINKSGNNEFAKILGQKANEISDIKFSKHASTRLNDRNIEMDEARMEKLKSAVSMAEKKGVKDSLVVMNDVAFVVNINNKTVITAVNSQELKENVFTNIDGAVFA